MSGAASLTVLWAMLAGAPEAGRPAIWFVDVERVLLESAEGKKVRASMEKQQAAVEADVRAREDVLFDLRKRLEATGDPALRAEYDQRAGAHEGFVASQSRALEAAQDAEFQPLLDRLVALIDAAQAKGPGVLVLDRAEHPPVGAVPCDATGWLERAFAGKKADAPAATEKCRPKAIALVDVQKLLAGLDEAKAAASRIGVLQRQRQEELDRAARALADQRGPKADQARLELADRYLAWQKDLAARESKESARVVASALARVEDARRPFARALFLQKVEGTTALEGACDVTGAFLDNKGSPSAEALVAACPALQGAR